MYSNADVLTADKFIELKEIVIEKKPWVIIVVEVKPKNFKKIFEKSEFNIPGYNIESTDNLKPEDRGRGIFMYLHESLVYSPVILKNIFVDKSPYPVELLTCEIRLKEGKFLLSGVYRSGNSTLEGNQALFKAKEFFYSQKYLHNMYIGDYNFPKLRWPVLISYSVNSLESKFLDCLGAAYLRQYVSENTRGRGTDAPTTLDLVISERDCIEKIEHAAPLGGSDHSTLFIKYRCTAELKPDRVVIQYKKADYARMVELIKRSSEEWEALFQESKDDVNKQWSIFSKIYNDAEEQCVPRKIVRSGIRTFHVPLDRKSLKKKRKKYHLWQRFMQTKEGEHYEEFRRVVNQVRRITRKITMNCEKDIAKKAKSDPKLLYDYMKAKTQVKSTIPDLYMSDDEDEDNMATEDLDKANVFAKFFSSVQTREPDSTWDLLGDPEITHKLEIDITREEILKKLKNLKPRKSPGPDCMHPQVLQEVREAIVDPLYIIFQTSVRTCTVPDEWKIAHITAIYKKDNKHCAGNYRPVSLTSIVCKLLESFIRDSLVNYMNNNNLFTKKQFGFLKGRSTVLQLLKVIDRWTEILDEGGWVDVIYCDFRKAFDTVPHRRLLTVMRHYGVENPVLGWVKSFLSGRKQRVFVGDKASDWHPVISGVPQGSVLGPILFVMYINTMVEDDNTNIDQFLFADDAKVSKAIFSNNDCVVLQQGLDQMVEWSNDSLLGFHPGKCKSMRIQGRVEADIPHQYQMKGTTLERTDVEKDLGVKIDNKLTFEKHINGKISQANQIWGLIRRTFKYMNKFIFRTLFTAKVRSIVEYAAPVWNPHRKKLIEDIEKVQKRASKHVPGLSKLPYQDRLRALKLPTLQYRRYRGDMIEMWKITHEKYDPDVVGNLINLQESRARGHIYNVAKPALTKNLDVRKFSFKMRVIEQWNNLPESVVTANTINTFKNRLDKLWDGSAVYYDHETNVFEITSNRNVRYLDKKAGMLKA